jgi:hypothetical protein
VLHIFGVMDIAQQKLSLIERIMKVGRQNTLQKVEEILIRSEMEARAEESVKAIEQHEVITFDQFTENNQSWLKKQATK